MQDRAAADPRIDGPEIAPEVVAVGKQEEFALESPKG